MVEDLVANRLTLEEVECGVKLLNTSGKFEFTIFQKDIYLVLLGISQILGIKVDSRNLRDKVSHRRILGHVEFVAKTTQSLLDSLASFIRGKSDVNKIIPDYNLSDKFDYFDFWKAFE